MAKSNIKSMDALFTYEKTYADELRANPIGILREIRVSKEDLDDIANHIGILYRSNNKKSLQISFPVTVSLFLVWCTVYEYKDGDMWSNIFNKLKIEPSTNHMRFFGDIFLNVLNEYELMQVKEGEGKKYLSPILMHGYISNHYAYNLFDYLNRVYSIVLEEDTSQEAIESVWNDIFIEDIELKNIQKNLRSLESEKIKLLEEIRSYGNIDDEIITIRRENVEELEIEVNNLEELIQSNQEKIEIINRKIDINASIDKEIDDLEFSFSRLRTKFDNGVNNKELKDVNDLIDEVKKIVQVKNNMLEIKKEQLIKENKGIKNKLSVKRETLISIKTKITTLGQGGLDNGWERLKEYNKLTKELGNIELQIKKKQKYENVAIFQKNATIKQILTASLYNLKISHPEYFKDFMIKTIQMMGGYFSGEEIDDSHPLYEVFIEWTDKKPEKAIYTEVNVLKPGDPNGGNKRRRLVLQTMKRPYIQLDTYKFLLNIVIPEQCFTLRQDTNPEPYYILIDNEGKEINLDLNYLYHNENLYIREMKIPVESALYKELLFKWYNLIDIHDISLNEIMIFDGSGILLNQNKVNNGYYYIVCEKSWFLDEGLIINEHKLLDNHRIYEIYINETKATFRNKDNNEIYEIIATNYDICYLANYNPIDGIYSNNLPIVTGTMPELFVNHIDVDPTLLYLKIYVNDNLIYNMELEHLIRQKIWDEANSTIRANIYKLLGLKSTAYKIKIVLGYINREAIFEEEFYYLPKTQFKYTNEGLRVKIERGMRLTGNNCKQSGMEYLIPLKNKEGETFSIYYNNYGWVKLWVEVPSVNIIIFDKYGKEYNKNDILYGNKRKRIKDLFIQWETTSERVKSILLFDDNHYLETRLYMKNGRVKISIEPYYDIFKGKDVGQLCYRVEDNVLIEEKTLLEIYDKWGVNNIKVHQKEEPDEYILGIDYEQNFLFSDTKYLEILNDDRIIIEKRIKDQIYVYIKKKDLTSNKLKINIVYYEEYEDIFGKDKKAIVAGTTAIELKSKIEEIDKILNNGILITEFKYSGEVYSLKHPIELEKIKKAISKNFIGEEMYMSSISYDGISHNVYFYIDTEKKVLPFLIDEDSDGVQYNPKNGRVFWEISPDKEIMAPLDDMKYIIKEGKQ